MKTTNEVTQLIRASTKDLSGFGAISVLPDYFVDRFMKIESLDDLISAIKKKSLEGGGGSVRGIRQSEVKGGNAVNLGYALAKFGVAVNLIAIAESLSAEALRSTFRAFPNVRLEIVEGKNGFTVALEFVEAGRHVNVMVSDSGDLENFDGSKISHETWDLIGSSKIVSVVNWSANKKGNDLCKRAFSLARRKGALTFFDPADVAELAGNLPEFRKEVMEKALIDYMSVNDNELRVICKTLFNHSIPLHYCQDELVKSVKLLSSESNALVDLHTRNLSVSCNSINDDCYLVPCHRVDQKIVTGAGDVWDAADLIGHLLKWDVEYRLRFANAAAGLYVSRQEPIPPSVGEVCSFMDSRDEFYTY